MPTKAYPKKFTFHAPPSTLRKPQTISSIYFHRPVHSLASPQELNSNLVEYGLFKANTS